MIRINVPKRITCLPHAVLFDTDNTLYPYEPAHSAAFQAVREKVVNTFSLNPKDFNHAFSQAREEIKNRLGQTASSHSRLLYLQRMLEIMGLGSQVLLALDFIPTAIVTDLTAQIQFRKVVYFGLDHHFNYIVTSEEAGFDKPHKAPFLIALEKMQPKGNCIWMIGDNPINDIRGSKESINAITFQKIHEGVELGLGQNSPDVSFSDFRNLRELLSNL